jgi:hypothetical protein
MQAPVSQCRRPQSNEPLQGSSLHEDRRLCRSPMAWATGRACATNSPFLRRGSQRPDSIAMFRASDPRYRKIAAGTNCMGVRICRRPLGADRGVWIAACLSNPFERRPFPIAVRPANIRPTAAGKEAFSGTKGSAFGAKAGRAELRKEAVVREGKKDACRAQAGAWVFSEPAEENMTAFCVCAYGLDEGIRFIRSGPWWRNGPTRQRGRSRRELGNRWMSSLDFPSSAHEKPS